MPPHLVAQADLKAAIAMNGRHKYQIAYDSGMHPNSLGQILSGRRVPTESEKQRLAAVLERSVESLFPTEAGVTRLKPETGELVTRSAGPPA